MTRLALLLCLLCTAAGAEPATVVRVIDGDTLQAATGGRTVTIRVAGLDTPETGRNALCAREQALGEAASAYARHLLPVGSQVDLTPAKGRDRYGRYLAIVTLPDGRELAQVMIAAGHGVPYHGHGRRMDWCAPAR